MLLGLDLVSQNNLASVLERVQVTFLAPWKNLRQVKRKDWYSEKAGAQKLILVVLKSEIMTQCFQC